ncbi:regulator of chromosome condensation isoform X2 [Callorhinchus milii]|uniref:Regulator of chromosome condensation n=2 Tax=Callorhinchus milii TaxID=7868 RepID=V9KRH2_CALMI|nr:regulator of chromosome condensation isoform X2 [Callorhinchus milii]XP_042194776.1 regulator of chromosome condensation isoform X2 [Callorhinchus milii]XP_042194777.1 regulator of chromosome condensation isoform X2 [Callorhinchus milii]XP_042194778.1 regulator of chromosome condensation isoform X2 [Callorhinchus milii]|eukprot:gi/632954619/ref/XP_007893058.1/ PREDICTED: regulator of chromosome condensation [Callorhinchus milii]
MSGKKTVKRSNKSPDQKKQPEESKRVKISHSSHKNIPGIVLTLGQGDVGQLGLGENVLVRKKPAFVKLLPEKITQAEAGGMHTVCLSVTGNVYTFGCNDDGALGRETSEEGSEMVPERVILNEHVVQVSAGDSHTAALTDIGEVYIWGSFRDNTGIIGLLEPMKKSCLPLKIPLDVAIVKISSGNDHLAMLSIDGDIYTSGSGDQGQLGRVAECFTNRGGRRGLDRLLIPKSLYLRAKGGGRVTFRDVFCGAYLTFAISKEGHVYGFGLSNYHQLGTPSPTLCFVAQKLTAFKNSAKSWVKFSGGLHHTICLDSEGNVYSLGRSEYGRLGLGEDTTERSKPSLVPGLSDVKSVCCGTAVSYAVTKDGQAYAWGMGTNFQLSTSEEEDVWSPIEMSGQQLASREVLSISSGGQHTVLLVQEKQHS